MGGPYLSFSCEKFPNTIVCYRKYCRLGEAMPLSPPSGSAPGSSYPNFEKQLRRSNYRNVDYHLLLGKRSGRIGMAARRFRV